MISMAIIAVFLVSGCGDGGRAESLRKTEEAKAEAAKTAAAKAEADKAAADRELAKKEEERKAAELQHEKELRALAAAEEAAKANRARLVGFAAEWEKKLDPEIKRHPLLVRLCEDEHQTNLKAIGMGRSDLTSNAAADTIPECETRILDCARKAADLYRQADANTEMRALFSRLDSIKWRQTSSSDAYLTLKQTYSR